MLYICPTPIGNLGDITLRVLETLRAVDLVAAEDTRRTGLLLAHYQISKPLVSFYEHNELRRLPELLERLRAGGQIALVSDAGMPGICDPGYRLIAAALDEGLEVVVLPGPSAIETALVSSGFPTDSFTFLGYLPRRKGVLEKALRQVLDSPRSCVAFETPHRLQATLLAAAGLLGSRRIAVCRELTKKFEEIRRGTATELLQGLPEKVKGEIVLVFEGSNLPETDGTEEEEEHLRQMIATLLAEELSPRRVSELMTKLTGMPRRKAYGIALEMKNE